MTERLLEQNLAEKGTLALVAVRGGSSLLTIDPNGNGGKGKRCCEIENALLALCKCLEVKKVAFSKFRDTSSRKWESIDRRLTDLFDGYS